MPIQQIFLGGGGGSAKTYVEDVFSIDLWNGNFDTTPAPININNGIDLSASGRGGLVWTKSRTINANSHQLFDTERGLSYAPDWGGPIYSNLTSGTATNAVFSSFNSDGFSLTAGDAASDALNGDSDCDYLAWTFGKQKGFFDIVKYQGNNNVAQSINHNLGCVPGCIIIKNTSTGTENWAVYHKNLSSNVEGLKLNTNAGEDGADWWNSTSPTSTQFTVGTLDLTNKDTDDYIAYLFADGDDTDAQIFGDNEDESIIKCGGYTGALDIDLGWEPQWVLVKNAASTGTGNWYMLDSMRGFAERSTTNNGAALEANSSGTESPSQYGMGLLSSGLQTNGGALGNSGSDWDYIYIAIRRGPMKKPTDATKVFAIDYGNGSINIPNFDSGFPVDWALTKVYGSSDPAETITRLTGTMALKTTTPDEEVNNGVYWATDSNVGFAGTSDYTNTRISWMFQRAPGFFDIVAYDGTGVARTQAHKLGVVPELIIVKARNVGTEHWWVYNKTIGEGKALKLNSNNDEDEWSGYWNDTAPTSSVFSLATYDGNNGSGKTYVAYLFASCAGISSVGTYTGNGGAGNALVSVNCGFTTSARFVMIKRTDAAGDWYVFDTLRGINYGTEPYILLNSPDAQDTTKDYIKPQVAGGGGFNVLPDGGNSPINTTGDYIYLAIA